MDKDIMNVGSSKGITTNPNELKDWTKPGGSGGVSIIGPNGPTGPAEKEIFHMSSLDEVKKLKIKPVDKLTASVDFDVALMMQDKLIDSPRYVSISISTDAARNIQNILASSWVDTHRFNFWKLWTFIFAALFFGLAAQVM